MATSTIEKKLPNELGNFCLYRYASSGTSSDLKNVKITMDAYNQWSPILYYDSDGGMALLIKRGASTFSIIKIQDSTPLTQFESSQTAQSGTMITASLYGNRRYCFVAYRSISVEEV